MVDALVSAPALDALGAPALVDALDALGLADLLAAHPSEEGEHAEEAGPAVDRAAEIAELDAEVPACAEPRALGDG